MLSNFALNYPNLKVGRFTLAKGETIPIHLHPGQYGMAYLLSGRCELYSYRLINQAGPVYNLSLPSIQILEKDQHSVLTPTDNAHKIVALEESCFFDVFAPGKSDGLLSTYLDIIQQTDQEITARAIDLSEAKLPKSILENNCHPIDID